MKKVSIIIPVYNSELYLKQCIDSVLMQTYPNIEVIAIDDASTDMSFHVLNTYQDPRLNIQSNPINLGISCTRNKGIQLSNGEYICFVDSDDYIEPDMVEKLIKYAENKGIVSCVYNSFFGKISSKKEKKGDPIVCYSEKQAMEKEATYCWNKMYHRDILSNIEFPEQIYYEDIAFTYTALASANTVIQINENLYHYRRNLTGVTCTNKYKPNTTILDISTSCDIMEQNFKDLNLYQLYSDIIHNIQLHFSLLTIMDISLWYKIPYEERIHICDDLYQYYCWKYQSNLLQNNGMTEEKRKNNRFYQLRLLYTEHFFLKNIEYNQNLMNQDVLLERTKQKIMQYGEKYNFN